MKLMQRKHKETCSLVKEKIARENQFEDFNLKYQKYKFNENTFEKYLKYCNALPFISEQNLNSQF